MALESLMSEASRYAHFTMKRSGHIAPIMIADTGKNILFFAPDGLTDGQSKDLFANQVRLVAGCHNATALVLILECWTRRPDEDGKLDMTPPSESMDREEMVVLIGQSSQGNLTRMLPIVRLDNGRFWNLGDPIELGADSFEGRFANLMPPSPMSEERRAGGLALIEAMGLKVAILKSK